MHENALVPPVGVYSISLGFDIAFVMSFARVRTRFIQIHLIP